MGNIHQIVNERLPALPGRHCSSLYAEPDTSQVCLNTHLIYIYFFSPPPFFLFCRVISHRWRSDTFDNSGPCGVNTELIACSSVSLFASIYQHIRMPLSRPSPNRQTGGIGTNEDEVVSHVCVLLFLIVLYMCLFYNIKNSFLRRVQTAIFTAMIRR